MNKLERLVSVIVGFTIGVVVLGWVVLFAAFVTLPVSLLIYNLIIS